MTDSENPFYSFWNTKMEGNSFVLLHSLFPDRSDIHAPTVASVTVLEKQIPLVRLDFVGRCPVVSSDELSKFSKFPISGAREWDLNTSCLIKSSEAGCSCRGGQRKLVNASPWHSALQSLTPLLCLLRFQGRGPTRPSCWAADWPAAALHEGWVKSQEGPHDPAQPGNHLFQKSSLFGDCSHLLSLRPPTTPTASFNKAVRHQLKSALLVRSDVLLICTAERPSRIIFFFFCVYLAIYLALYIFTIFYLFFFIVFGFYCLIYAFILKLCPCVSLLTPQFLLNHIGHFF